MSDDLLRSNSLVDLAARIKAEHEAAAGALKRSVEHAIAAGDLLIEAKAQVPHGQWLPWLKEHCQIPERTARLYMRLAKNKTEIGNVADLTVRGAAALLASPPDSLVAAMADAAIEDLDIAAYERCEAERAKRKNAASETEAALLQVISLGGNTSFIGQAIWDQLGVQFMAAIDRWKSALEADFDEPFAPLVAATAACFDARNISREMLRLIRNDEVVAS
jgi:hypothetical protein